MPEFFEQGAAALSEFNAPVVAEFRANGGKVGGQFDGGDLLLLTTTGAKSGQPRLLPLVYFDVDGRLLLVGSFGGAPKDPAWAHNLRANPQAHVEIGTESYDAVARELPEDERAALYPRVVEKMAVFGDYQNKTDRRIPIFELTRS